MYSDLFNSVHRLERPCFSHVPLLYHTSENHSEEDVANTPDSTDVDFGHAAMFTCPGQAQLSKMSPTEQFVNRLPDLPTVDLWTLLQASHRINRKRGEITPVEAITTLMTDERFHTFKENDFNALHDELVRRCRCYG